MHQEEYEGEQFISHSMARNYISMRWSPLWSRLTHLFIVAQKQQYSGRHVIPLGCIFTIPNKPVFAVTLYTSLISLSSWSGCTLNKDFKTAYFSIL